MLAVTRRQRTNGRRIGNNVGLDGWTAGVGGIVGCARARVATSRKRNLMEALEQLSLAGKYVWDRQEVMFGAVWTPGHSC